MELILTAVIIILSVLLLLQDRAHAKEKSNLINALIAKNAQEKAQLDVTSGNKPPIPQPPELVPSESLTDDEWERVAGNI